MEMKKQGMEMRKQNSVRHGNEKIKQCYAWKRENKQRQTFDQSLLEKAYRNV